jgi:AraC-like DNA-binding protein
VLQDPGDTADAATWGTRIGASERTIARMFRAETGMSFAQWRAQARLAQALTHLAQGKSVATVAAAAGYDSASAFTAMFRKAFGAAPRDLRAQAA